MEGLIKKLLITISILGNIVFIFYVDIAEDKIYSLEQDLNKSECKFNTLNSQIAQGLCLPLLEMPK